MRPVVLGQQIGADLVSALGLPRNTVSFTLRCRPSEVVSVECEYYPEDSGIVPALAVYDLVRRQAPRQAEPFHFDTWMTARTERAHCEFMERTARRLPCDVTTEDIARYMGAALS